MEDGVSEVKSMFPPLNLNSEDGSKREDNEEKEEGSVSTEKVEEVKEEDIGTEHTGKDCVTEYGAKDNGGGGGLINNLISSLLSPRTGKATEHESGSGVFKSEEDDAADDDDGGDHGERGGLLSNLVSNFFHRSESEGEGVVETEKKKEEEEIIVYEKIKRIKTENEANSVGGGIIHNIVSHLPVSLPDDAVPTADEATILINSLVRD